MKKYRKVLGIAILILTLAGVIVATCLCCGWRIGLTVWGISLAVLALLWVSIWLLTGGDAR